MWTPAAAGTRAIERQASCVAQNFLHHAAWFAVGDPLFLAVVMVKELGVVEPEEMKERGVIIIRANGIDDSLVPKLICLAVNHSALKTAARDPGAETLSIVIASGL